MEQHFFGLSASEVLVVEAAVIMVAIAFLLADRADLTLQMVLIYMLVGAVSVVLHDFAHRYFATKHGHDADIRFWGLGTVIMFLTAWLYGNAFAQPYRYLVNRGEGIDETREMGVEMVAWPARQYHPDDLLPRYRAVRWPLGRCRRSRIHDQPHHRRLLPDAHLHDGRRCDLEVEPFPLSRAAYPDDRVLLLHVHGSINLFPLLLRLSPISRPLTVNFAIIYEPQNAGRLEQLNQYFGQDKTVTYISMSMKDMKDTTGIFRFRSARYDISPLCG